MKFIGIHDGHNASVSVIEDGFIKYAVQEERFTYIKNQGGLPSNSIKNVIQNFRLDKDDYISFAGIHNPTYDWANNTILKLYAGSDTKLNIIRHFLKNSKIVYKYYKNFANKNRRLEIFNFFSGSKKIDFIDHHLCHASSVYFGAGKFNEDVLVITADGDGDGKCAAVFLGNNGNLIEVLNIPTKDSLGRLYSYITFLFNMVPYEHEYKVMGLAPYCKDTDKIEKCKKEFYGILNFPQKDSLAWKYAGSYPTIQTAGNEIRRIFNRYRFDIVAAALQSFIEEIVVEWIKRITAHFKIRKILLSGGIFMNVKANMLVAKIPGINSVYVMPSCGDESNAIGASYNQYFKYTNRLPEPICGYYLGDEFKVDYEELKKLDKTKFDLNYFEDINVRIAELLSAGEIVGRIKGRMEFGARALGNRSILADPSGDNVLKTINDMIKNRDFWMPFAPSVIAEDLENYFYTDKAAENYEYMIFTAESRPEKRRYAKSALHPYDYTGRPQAVRKEHNPDFYNLLVHYKKITGESLILNTSYNMHGYPIVRSQPQALHVFSESGLKYLALDNYLLSKKSII